MQREITLVKKVRKRIQSEFYKEHYSQRKTKIITKRRKLCSVTVWPLGTTYERQK